MGQPNDRISGVAGVLVWTTNYEAMVEFYRDVLQLEPKSENSDHTNFVWGDFRLTIAIHSEVEGPATDPLRMMLNFGVEEIHAVYERLRGSGVVFSRPPEREPWGDWIAIPRSGRQYPTVAPNDALIGGSI